LSKKRKNIGGTKLFGMDLDPNKDLCLVEDKDKGQKAYYKDQPMKYLDYYEELANRERKLEQGKDAGGSSIGIFAGMNFDKNGKIIKS
tara:strand:+ start:116 stop:379 length:264 start_codon:yes stop_codon:yes gene_type:complete